MSTYRTEWPCCDSVTETECWVPEECPFCRAAARIADLEQRIAVQADLLERAEAALRATTWEAADVVAWLGQCDHDVGECHCTAIRAVQAGVDALAAIRAAREGQR